MTIDDTSSRLPADPVDLVDADPADAAPAEALRSLRRIVGLLNGDHDTATVMQLVVDGVAAATGFRAAAVNLVRGDGSLEVVAVAGSTALREELLGSRWSRAELDADFAVAEVWGALRFVPAGRSLSDAPTWVPDHRARDTPGAWQAEDLLFAPLCSPTGDLLGVLSVDLPLDGLRPGPERRALLEVYAVHAGVALDHAQQRERLRERIRLDRSTRAIVESATRLDAEHVVDSSVGAVADALDCDVAWLRTFDGTGELPGRGRAAVATRGPAGTPGPSRDDLVPGPELLAVASSLAHRAWAAQSWVVVGEEPAAAVPGLPEPGRRAVVDFVGRLGADAMVLVPLGAGGTCLGCLVLVRRRGHAAWSTTELEAARQLGRDLGRAVANARAYERELRLRAELEDLDRYKSALIGTICHELRTPLSAIHGHVRLTDALLAAAPRSQEALGRNIGRMTTLIDDLLVLAEVGNPQGLERRPVDLATVLQEAVDPVRVTAEERGVTVRTRVGAGPGAPGTAYVVDGDAVELERALGNLVGNAVKYSDDGGGVDLRLERRAGPAGDRVVFTCTDRGIGIAAEDRERLFTEFFRSADPRVRARPGSGLGLSIVARVVERHGGRVLVESAPGRGSTFTVELPASASGA